MLLLLLGKVGKYGKIPIPSSTHKSSTVPVPYHNKKTVLYKIQYTLCFIPKFLAQMETKKNICDLRSISVIIVFFRQKTRLILKQD
jgi:hypothetical protein